MRTLDLGDQLDDTTRRHVVDTAERFEVMLLEQARNERPDDFEVLVRLGELYSRRGQVEDGLDIDTHLVELAPADPIVRYNLACSLAMSGQIEDAFLALGEALRLGYDDLPHLLGDEDLLTLRDDPRFDAIVARLRRRRPKQH